MPFVDHWLERQAHHVVRATFGRKLIANQLEAQRAIKIGGAGSAVAPELAAGLGLDVRDAGENELSPKAAPLHSRLNRHSAQPPGLWRGQIRVGLEVD